MTQIAVTPGKPAGGFLDFLKATTQDVLSLEAQKLMAKHYPEQYGHKPINGGAGQPSPKSQVLKDSDNLEARTQDGEKNMMLIGVAAVLAGVLAVSVLSR